MIQDDAHGQGLPATALSWGDILLFAAYGAALGLLPALGLASMVLGNYSGTSFPPSSAGEIPHAAEWIIFFRRHEDGLLFAATIAGISSFAAYVIKVARVLNPELPAFPFRSAVKPAVAWTALLLCAAAASGIELSGNDPAFWGPSSVAPLLEGLFQSAVCGAVIWIILSPDGWAGRFDAWKKPRNLATSSVMRAATWGAAYGAIQWVVSSWTNRLGSSFYSIDTEIWQRGVGEIVRASSTTAALLSQSMLSAVTAASLAIALADTPVSFVTRLRRVFPAGVIFVLSIIGSYLVRRDLTRNHQWDVPSLSAAAVLPEASVTPSTVVSLGNNRGPVLYADSWPYKAEFGFEHIAWSSDFSGGQPFVPATEANAQALIRFLSGPGRTSRYRQAALEALVSSYAMMWEPDRTFAALRTLGSDYELPLLDVMYDRARLAGGAPITPENRARLETYSDPKRYVETSDVGRLVAARMLFVAWIRFGDIEKARFWRDIDAQVKDREEVLARHPIPSRPPRSDCTVSGRFVIEGRGGRPARVGLFLAASDNKSTFRQTAWRGFVGWFADSRPLGPDGSFKFDHLGEGSYSLSVLAPSDLLPADAAKLRASRNPGVVNLTEGNPHFDTGTIIIGRKSS